LNVPPSQRQQAKQLLGSVAQLVQASAEALGAAETIAIPVRRATNKSFLSFSKVLLLEWATSSLELS
jgi:hypothetical protein